jgi:hypothetical protein
MEQNKKPVQQYYYSDKEWARLGCGPLPKDREQGHLTQEVMARANPWQDGKFIKGSN